jgi:hypothetical protein
MDAIRKELGENKGSVIDEYRQKITEAQMPEPVQKQAQRELRLDNSGHRLRIHCTLGIRSLSPELSLRRSAQVLVTKQKPSGPSLPVLWNTDLMCGITHGAPRS